jgi:hypothetical protein
MKNFLFLISIFLLFNTLSAQSLTQTLRGEIRDQITEAPIPGATVMLQPSEPLIGTVSNLDGQFRLNAVPIGRYTLTVKMLGYQDFNLPNVVIGSGKEVVLQISLSETTVEIATVEISAEGANKAEAINELATVSARQFSVEETKRYAGALNDPGRMAQSFAGVTVNADGSNEIVVRGNSPRGLLWRMEGIEIPNPNHFSNPGSSGGAISMLSNNMMANSDFFTGAFPADYGNAASGVFDIRLRKGNNEKREYAIQAGVIGSDIALEGPFKKGKTGSYLVNYRYSSLSLLQKLGVEIVGDAIPVFQDLSFNINLPTEKAGQFGLFGIGGISSINQEYFGKQSNYKDRFRTYLGVAGLTHSYMFNDKTWLKTIVAATGTANQYKAISLDTNNVVQHTAVDEGHQNYAHRVASTLNHKINRKNSIRTGFIGSLLKFNLKTIVFDNELDQYRTDIDQVGTTGLLQGFFNWQHRINEKTTLNTGLHYSRFLLNGKQSLEPRAGIKWNFNGSQILSAGFGVHSRLEDPAVYFARIPTVNNQISTPNTNLGFSKARHYVVGYETMLSKRLHLKTELYYQDLYDVPVESGHKSARSTINMSQGFSTFTAENTGAGRNYGVEMTFEKNFSNKYYFMMTNSFFDSRYRGSDQVWRNTAFNNGYAGSFLAGKEFEIRKKNTLSLNVRVIYSGGRKYTPVLLDESIATGEGVYDDQNAFSASAADYFRTDLGISYTINRKKTARVWKIDIQNVSNRLNEYNRYFNTDSQQEEIQTMTGIIPTLSYRIEF